MRRRCCRTAKRLLTMRSSRARGDMRDGRSHTISQRRGRLPAHAEQADVPGDLARNHARRRHRLAAEHEPRRPIARPLHQSRRASSCHRRGGAASIGSTARARRCRRASRLGPRRRQCRRTPRSIRQVTRTQPSALHRQREPPRHDRGPCALHLHVRHDRPAQGRQRQPRAAACSGATGSPG